MDEELNKITLKVALETRWRIENLKQSTKDSDYYNLLTKYTLGIYSGKPLHEITYEHISGQLLALRDGKKTNKRAKPSTHNALLKSWRTLYRFANKHYSKHLKSPVFLEDPSEGISKLKLSEKRTVISIIEDPAQLYRFVATALVQLHVDKKVKNSKGRFITGLPLTQVAIDAILLILLTGCRKSEIVSLKWKSIDLESKKIILEDTKVNQRQVIPLSHLAYAILKVRYLTRGRFKKWVFPSPSPNNNNNHLKEVRGSLKRINKLAGIDENITLHSLRRTASSIIYDVTGDYHKAATTLRHKLKGETLKYLSDEIITAQRREQAQIIQAAIELGHNWSKTHCKELKGYKLIAKLKDYHMFNDCIFYHHYLPILVCKNKLQGMYETMDTEKGEQYALKDHYLSPYEIELNYYDVIGKQHPLANI